MHSCSRANFLLLHTHARARTQALKKKNSSASLYLVLDSCENNGWKRELVLFDPELPGCEVEFLHLLVN